MNRLLQLKEQLVSGENLDEEELNRIIFGENHRFRIMAWKCIRENKVFSDHSHLNNYTLDQIRSKTFDKLVVSYKGAPDLDRVRNMDYSAINQNTIFGNGLFSSDNSFCILGGVHFFLYLRSISLLGTEKHLGFYHRAVDLKDIGCFGLTELFHGSNVKGMQTEAHYDHEKKEFVVHTPTKEAMKFWIGGAAKTATNCVVWAQLFIDWKCYGVHAFIVPIRDRQTHKPMPGVLLGDCGHKPGMNGVDNGFIIFDKVRIPKDNLLDKISGVDQNGKFRTVIQNEEKRFGLQLGALSGGRFSIASNCSSTALQALTIAIRYSNERRQFKGKNDTMEKKLIEYPLMKRRLMPLLATCLAYYRTSIFYITQNDGNFEKFMEENNPLIEQLHAISSVLKAKTSWYANECIQECRQAMGGHGYSGYSKIGTLYNDNDVNLTWEGDNHVLIQQTSKYVLEQAQKVLQKGKTSNNPLLHFLNDAPSELFELTRQNLTSLDRGLEFLQYKLMRKVEETGMKMMELKNKKLPVMDIWNNAQVFLGREVAMIYGDLAILTCMKEGIAQTKNSANRDLFVTATRLWMLRIYRNDEFVDMTHHSLIETLMGQDCDRMEKVSLELLRMIGPDDVVSGSPFADPDGRGIQKYLNLILNKPSNERAEWWEMLLDR